MRLGEAHDVHPVSRPPFTKMWGIEQEGYELADCRLRIADSFFVKRFDFGGRERKSGKYEAEAADQSVRVRGGLGLQACRCEFR